MHFINKNEKKDVISWAVVRVQVHLPALPILLPIGQIGTWFWGIFSEFASMVKETPILLYVIIASIVFTGIGLLIKVLKKMGFRGRRS